MSGPRFDLQSHSTHSDGELPAAEVVQRAAESGVELLALSDHDTISGVSEALEAGERAGVRVEDLIVELAGTRVHGVEDIQRLMVADLIGAAVDVEVLRNGLPLRLRLVPRELGG